MAEDGWLYLVATTFDETPFRSARRIDGHFEMNNEFDISNENQKKIIDFHHRLFQDLKTLMFVRLNLFGRADYRLKLP